MGAGARRCATRSSAMRACAGTCARRPGWRSARAVVASIDRKIERRGGLPPDDRRGAHRHRRARRRGAGARLRDADAARAAVRQAAAAAAHRGPSRLPESRRHAGHQPRQGADDGDAVRARRHAGRVEGQPVPALHGAHVRVRPASRRVEGRIADHGRGDHGARRVLPRAVHRPRAEPELVRAHGALADRSPRTATWPRCRKASRCRTGRCCSCGRRSSARR